MLDSFNRSGYGSLPARIALVLGAALVVAACNRGSAAYRGSTMQNPLEIPPDLTSVPQNPTNRVPGRDAPASAVEQDQFEKYRQYQKWEDFEEYLAWKRETGEEDKADFDAYRAARNAGQLPNTSVGDVTVDSVSDGSRRLQLKDEFDNAWVRVGRSLEAIGTVIESTDTANNDYVVMRPHPDGPKKGMGKLKVWRKSHVTYVIHLQDNSEEELVVVTVHDKTGDLSTEPDANNLIEQIAFQLRTFARREATTPSNALLATPVSVRIGRDDGGHLQLIMDDPLPRAWRRVGITLDQMAFTVDEADRTENRYTVRYIDSAVGDDENFVDKLTFWKKGEAQEAARKQYHVKLASINDGTKVVVLDDEGIQTPVGDRILDLIYNQIK